MGRTSWAGLWLLDAPQGRGRGLTWALLCGSCPMHLPNQCDLAQGAGHCVWESNSQHVLPLSPPQFSRLEIRALK